MPSPIGHSLFGIITYNAFGRRQLKWNWLAIILVIVVANLPDLDFLPGVFVDDPSRYHHGFSHSLGFALILFGLFYLIERKYRPGQKPIYSINFYLLYTLHVVTDFFVDDVTMPLGEPLFWPFSHSYYFFPHPVFLNIQHSGNLSHFFVSVFSRHNLFAIFWEIVIAALLWLAIIGLKNLIVLRRWQKHSQ